MCAYTLYVRTLETANHFLLKTNHLLLFSPLPLLFSPIPLHLYQHDQLLGPLRSLIQAVHVRCVFDMLPTSTKTSIVLPRLHAEGKQA